MVAMYDRNGAKKEDIIELYSYLQKMSLDLTTDHEIHQHPLFSKGTFLHDDGFGIAFIEKGELKTHYNINPIFDVKLDEDLLNRIIGSNALIIHARKSSPGLEVNVDMLHPFLRNKPNDKDFAIALSHNGTIEKRELIKYDKDIFDEQGVDSDSLKFLFSLLTNHNKLNSIPKAFSETINNLPEYSGVNIFSIIIENNNSSIWVSRNYTKREKYFEIKYNNNKEGRLIIASEMIPTMAEDWDDLENHQTVRINGEIQFY